MQAFTVRLRLRFRISAVSLSRIRDTRVIIGQELKVRGWLQLNLHLQMDMIAL